MEEKIIKKYVKEISDKVTEEIYESKELITSVIELVYDVEDIFLYELVLEFLKMESLFLMNEGWNSQLFFFFSFDPLKMGFLQFFRRFLYFGLWKYQVIFDDDRYLLSLSKF